MKPGPTIVKKCPTCGGLIESFTLMSGNTFGATFWTDGKRDAPMLPMRPALVECPHCQTPLWLADLEKVGEYKPWEGKGQFVEAAVGKAPTMEGYQRVLEAGDLNVERERYVRTRLWWAGNDARRNGEAAPLSDAETQNLDALAALLDEANDEERLMKAEIMRELGRFDEALPLLEAPFDPKMSDVVEVVTRLAKQQQAAVAALPK